MAFDPLKMFSKKQPAPIPDSSKDEPEEIPAPEAMEKHITEEVKPKKMPARDANGKFISKKTAPKKESDEIPKEESVIKDKSGFKGPYISIFYSVEIRKYYEDGKWYFSIEDILPLGQKDPPLGSLDQLKEEEEINKVFEKVVRVIDDIPCSGAEGIVEIVNLTGANFPGPFIRWIEETATFPFEEPAPVNPK